MLPKTRITVILLFAAWTVDYIDRLVINVALPLIRQDLALSHSQAGLIVSSFFLAYAIAQIPGGMLADRYGAFRIAVVGLIAWSVFTGLTAVAFSFTSLIVIRVLFGFAQGVFPGAALKMLAERSVPEQRMTATGWVNSSNAFGGILAAVIAAIAIPLVGWRGMFLVIAVLGLFVLGAFGKWMPQPLVQPQQSGRRDPGQRRRALQLLRTPVMWLYVAVFFGYDVLVWGAQAWGASYLQEQFGLSPSASALLAIFPGISAVVVIILSGLIADRIGGRPKVLIIPAMVFAAAYALVFPHLTTVPMIVIAMTLGLGIASFAYIGAFALPLKYLAPTVTGLGSGMILFGGMVAGVIAPAVLGVLIESSGWSVALSALAVGPVIAIVAALFLPRSGAEFKARLAPELVADHTQQFPIGLPDLTTTKEARS
ncbi:MFS transporter [Leucobacter sp. G161]|uniref:MFS transporter n=1 Tax=Leucobacter sp. G161 TaxID=663704 RepID=UPI00073E4364|nr:MFS transporter [Leucobacter sp. G161]